MEKVQHTRGPWDAVKQDNNTYDGVLKVYGPRSLGRDPICVLFGHRWRWNVREANANLIASAPDLLYELQENRAMLISLRDSHFLHGAAAVSKALIQKRIEAAEKVINKATGE